MKHLTHTTTTTIWAVMPTVGYACITPGDYSRDNMGVLELCVS
jgi:hypothetical protein